MQFNTRHVIMDCIEREDYDYVCKLKECLVYPGLPGCSEAVDRHVNAPIELLHHEGGDEEAGPVEAVRAVDRHDVQWVIGDVVLA